MSAVAAVHAFAGPPNRVILPHDPMEDAMTKPLRFALLAAFALAAMAVRAQACNVECSEGEAYNDEAELCMPVGSFSW